MNAHVLPNRLMAVAAAALVCACGGGGGSDGAATPPDVPPAVGLINTDLQAKTLAARSIDALFAYDNMNSEVLIAGLVPLPVVKLGVGARPAALRLGSSGAGARQRPLIITDDGPGGGSTLASGTYTVGCATGSATTTYTDADGDRHVSAGDFAILAGSACTPEAGSPWALGGSVRVDVVGGTNIEQHLYFVSKGSAQMKVTHAGTPIGAGRTAIGIYAIEVSNTTDGAPPDQSISMPDMTIAHPDVNLRMTGLSFKVLASSRIETAAGRFQTAVDGLGDVDLALAVKSPLTIDSSTARFRPSAGVVTLIAIGFSVEVEYGSGDAVTIRVDNGRDGTVDRTVATTVAQLDGLLTTR